MTLFFIGIGLFRLLGFVFVVLLFIKITSLIVRKMHDKHSVYFQNHGRNHALSLAAERFAEGSISSDQYREIKSVLKD